MQNYITLDQLQQLNYMPEPQQLVAVPVSALQSGEPLGLEELSFMKKLKKAGKKAANIGKKAVHVAAEGTKIAANVAKVAAPVAEAIAPEYAPEIAAGTAGLQKAAVATKAADDAWLQQLFGWKDIKKGAKKAANIGKKVVHGAAEAAKVANKVVQTAAPIAADVMPEYADQINKGAQMMDKGTHVAEQVDSEAQKIHFLQQLYAAHHPSVVMFNDEIY